MENYVKFTRDYLTEGFIDLGTDWLTGLYP